MEGTRLLGFAILFAPQNQDFALLEYLAVHPDHRSAGIGRQLVLSAIDQTTGRQILAEVESVPTDAAADGRQQFYARCGFQPIAGLRYQLPLPGNPPPMELWVYRASPGPIQRETLFEWLTTIYTDVYRCSATDPRIGQMLAFVPDAV